MDIDEKVSGPGGSDDLPDDVIVPIVIDRGYMITILLFSTLMVISTIGNFTVLAQIVKRKMSGKASRVDLLLLHLAVADLMVTFLMMPVEIAWTITVSWKGGDFMCRSMMFARIFGLYLSSFVVICIAIDRYYAILKPLNLRWDVRFRWSISIAWVCAALASLPQGIIFHLEEHPDIKGYFQCVTYGSLPTVKHEFAYFLSNMVLMYVIPLMSTIYCSTAVLIEITRRIRSNDVEIRRSGVGILGRARARTFKMTITIILVFFICWTPYYAYCLWYWVDSDSLRDVDPVVQRAMWMFSCTNSCANPIVYGLFNRKRSSLRPGQSTPPDEDQALQTENL